MLTLDGSVKGGLIESRTVGVDGALKAGLHRARDGGSAKAVEAHTVLGLCIVTIILAAEVERRQGTHGNAIDESFALVLETTSWECARVETTNLASIKTRGCGYGLSDD